MSKLSFNFNPIGKVEEIIKKWKPKKCKTEKDYELSLFKFLEKELPGIDIVRQFGIGRLKVDIAVGKKVFIEIKNNLNSTSKLQRLIGQLALYEKEDIENLIILICGQTDKNLLRQLKKNVQDYNDNLFFLDEGSVLIIQK